MSREINMSSNKDIKHIQIVNNESNDTNEETKILNTLSHALENENNHSILEKTKKDIEQDKIEILNELQINDKQRIDMLEKLEEFQYIDDFTDIKEGSYIRWIHIPDKDSNSLNLKLRNGGFVCNTKVNKKLKQFTVTVQCNSRYGKPKFFTIHFINSIIFQKFTNQEKLLLTIMDYLHK